MVNYEFIKSCQSLEEHFKTLHWWLNLMLNDNFQIYSEAKSITGLKVCETLNADQPHFTISSISYIHSRDLNNSHGWKVLKNIDKFSVKKKESCIYKIQYFKKIWAHWKIDFDERRARRFDRYAKTSVKVNHSKKCWNLQIRC